MKMSLLGGKFDCTCGQCAAEMVSHAAELLATMTDETSKRPSNRPSSSSSALAPVEEKTFSFPFTVDLRRERFAKTRGKPPVFFSEPHVRSTRHLSGISRDQLPRRFSYAAHFGLVSDSTCFFFFLSLSFCVFIF